MATPISAAPDEPAHLVKAASVVRGQLIGEPSDAGHKVQVPSAIAFSHAQTCFAFDDGVAASCSPQSPESESLVDSTTTAGLYNPVYYALVGWPSLFFEGSSAIYAMRIASAILTAGLLALSVFIVSSWRSRALPLMGLLAATTPLAIFIGGVVNPSGPEIAGVLTVAVATYAIIQRPDEHLIGSRVAVLALAASIAMNMRGISPLWVALAVLLPLVLLRRGTELLPLLRTASVARAAGFTALAGACAVSWTLLTNSLGTSIENGQIDTDYPGAGTHPVIGFFTVVSRTLSYGRGMIAEFGWADTVASDTTLFLLASFIGAALIAGCVVLRGRALAVFAMALSALVFFPALIQASYVTQGGYIWQGRYAAPMLSILLFLTLALVDDAIQPRRQPRIINRLVIVTISLWAFTQFDSFVQTLGRYVVGAPIAWREFFGAQEWAPPGGVATLCVAVALTVTLLGVQAWRFAQVRSTDASSGPAFLDDARYITK